MAALDGYWARYEHTLTTLRGERPSTFAGVKTIHDRFEEPSAVTLLSPVGLTMTSKPRSATPGGSSQSNDGDYVWTGRHSPGAVFQYVEGDVYCVAEGT